MEKGFQASVKNIAGQAAGGFLFGVAIEYAFSVGGTVLECCTGKNEEMKKAEKRCQERLKKANTWKFTFENTTEKSSVFFQQAYKQAPTAKQVAIDFKKNI